MGEDVFKPNHKRIMLVIDGREYATTVFLSINDVTELVEESGSGETAYRSLVAKLIQSKLVETDERPTVERIVAQDNGLFQPYIDALVEEDSALNTHYETHADDPDVCRRLVLAVTDEWHESCKSIADAMPKIEIPVIKVWDQIAPAVEALQKSNLTAALEGAKRISEALTDTFSFGNRLKEILEPYQQMSAQITENLIGIASQLSELLQGIHIPKVSDEQKQELCQSHEQWGRYGWTIIPSADFRLFDTCPDTQAEANKLALAHFSSKGMEQFFTELLETKGIKKSDVNSAIFCFRNGQHKPCAMLLFALIDAKLIRLQRKEDYLTRHRDKSKYRASGKPAAERLAKHIKEEQDVENQLFMLLSYTNLFACLNIVFADGEDFRTQPKVINRNFVDHGMMTRSIIRKDCIQLFLLYYNLLELLNLIQDQ